MVNREAQRSNILLNKKDIEQLSFEPEKLQFKAQEIFRLLIEERCRHYQVDTSGLGPHIYEFVASKLLIFESLDSIIEKFPHLNDELFSTNKPLRRFSDKMYRAGLAILAFDKGGSYYCMHISSKQSKLEQVDTLLHELSHLADRAVVQILNLLIFNATEENQKAQLTQQHANLSKQISTIEEPTYLEDNLRSVAYIAALALAQAALVIINREASLKTLPFILPAIGIAPFSFARPSKYENNEQEALARQTELRFEGSLERSQSLKQKLLLKIREMLHPSPRSS